MIIWAVGKFYTSNQLGRQLTNLISSYLLQLSVKAKPKLGTKFTNKIEVSDDIPVREREVNA